MSAPTPAGPDPEGLGLQRPDFGRPPPALRERADRGYARFLAQARAAEHGAGQEPELEATRDDVTRPR